MPMPSNVKTWRHVVNQRYAASGSVPNDYRNALFAMISAMSPEVPTSGCWTHVQSCDSVNINTTPGSGTGAILSRSNLIWNTSAGGTQIRSWIVLAQQGLGTNFQLLIECHAGTGATSSFERFIRMFACADGYNTNGTTTTRPTAIGTEITIKDGSTTVTQPSGPMISSYTTYNSTFAPVVHVMHSTDGECTRAIFCAGGKSRAMYIFDKQCNPTAGLSPTFVLGASAQSTDVSTLTIAEWNALTKMQGANAALVYTAYATSEGYGTAMIPATLTAVSNEISGEWPLCPIGISSPTVGARGRHGTLYDLWWGTTNQAEGTTYPSDGTKTHAQFGHLVFPWNGSAPVLT